VRIFIVPDYARVAYGDRRSGGVRGRSPCVKNEFKIKTIQKYIILKMDALICEIVNEARTENMGSNWCPTSQQMDKLLKLEKEMLKDGFTVFEVMDQVNELMIKHSMNIVSKKTKTGSW